VLLPLVRPDGTAVLLVKPQFEVGRARVGRGGIVREPEAWQDALVGVAATSAGSAAHRRRHALADPRDGRERRVPRAARTRRGTGVRRSMTSGPIDREDRRQEVLARERGRGGRRMRVVLVAHFARAGAEEVVRRAVATLEDSGHACELRVPEGVGSTPHRTTSVAIVVALLGPGH
jgi:hypothetical protein